MRKRSVRDSTRRKPKPRFKDGRVRFNIDLKKEDYDRVTRLAEATDTNCLTVVRNLVDHVAKNRQNLDSFIEPFELSLICQRVCTLEVKAPPRTSQHWKALGLFYGLMGRRGFCTWAIEAMFRNKEDEELTALILERADLKEAIEICLTLTD